MSAIIRVLFIVLTAIFMSISAKAQSREISGIITDSEGEPIVGASLRVFSYRKTVSFGISNADGKFSLRVKPDLPDTLRLVATCLGFDKQEINIVKEAKKLKLVLHPSTKELKEVVVKAAEATQRGDTTSFRLHAFASKRDLTLEEGLKKLPGIEVSGNGTISYLGRDISNFYVEGLQLAGSRYNQITRNLPSDYVTNVELIENFNEAKVDSGRQSDKVAMNIRLSNKVRFRPVGTAEAGAGANSERGLYSLGLSGMFFATTFQSMINIKGGNIKEFSLDQSSGSISSGARNAIGNLTADTPPLPSKEYKAFDDHIISVNAIRALTQQNILRANVSYAYSHNSYDYDSRMVYYAGNEEMPVIFAESYSPHSSVYQTAANIDFSSDKRTSWLSNKVAVNYEFQHGSLDAVISDNDPVLQTAFNRNFRIADDFNLSFRNGEKRYSLSAKIGYNLTPVASIKVSDSPSGTFSGQQHADSHRAHAQLSTSFDWLLTKNSSLNLPVDADAEIEAITTTWNPNSSINNAYGRRASVAVQPTYELVTENRKIELNVAFGAKTLFLSAGNHASSNTQRLNRFFLSPLLHLKYNPTSRIAVTFSGWYDENAGDIAELLTGKIMRSFRVETMRSGVIGRTSNLLGSVSARYSNLLTLWFADMKLTANRRGLNTISTTDVSGGQISSGFLTTDNNVDAFTGSAGIGKHFRNIGLRINLRGNFSLSKSQTIQQGERIAVNNTGIYLRPSITFAPVNWFELQIDPTWNQTMSKYLQIERKTSGWNNLGRLSIFPTASVEIFGQVDCISLHHETIRYPTVYILDAGINWKVGKTRLSLNAGNLLNKRRYYYTSFNELNTFSYDFALQPRSCSLSAIVVF